MARAEQQILAGHRRDAIAAVNFPLLRDVFHLHPLVLAEHVATVVAHHPDFISDASAMVIPSGIFHQGVEDALPLFGFGCGLRMGDAEPDRGDPVGEVVAEFGSTVSHLHFPKWVRLS